MRKEMPESETTRGRVTRSRPLTGGSAVTAGHLLALPCLLGGGLLADAATGGRSLPIFLLLFVILSAALSIGAWLLLRLAERAIRHFRDARKG